MIQITDKSQCSGCTACASICTHDAIMMQPDVMGFFYPVVDKDKCVDCGLCENVCAFNDHYDTSQNLPEPDVYATRHKDMKEVETSRSGAAFIDISDYVFENGGVVYGAGYTDHFRVVHKRATTKEERDEFKGSKYVQSDLRGVLRQVKRDLKDGLTVMFSGTPCQTAGLNSYIGKNFREHLILVDIVCHGVPGPYIWKDYITYLEKKLGDKVCWVNFRDKQKYGWAAHHETILFEKKCLDTNSYSYLFLQNIMFRTSCAVCPFTNIRRPSDITSADFWGWEKVNPDLNTDDKGISLIIVNAEKGRRLFDAVKQNMNIYPITNLKDCLQPNLQHPSVPHSKREEFEKDYARHGFTYVVKKYGDMGWRYKIKMLRQKLRIAQKFLIKN